MKRFLTMAMAVIMMFASAVSLTACGGGGSSNAGDRVQIEFRCETSGEAKIAYINAIKAYNEGQGKEDGVYVNAAYNVSSNNLGQAISSASAQTPNVVCIKDDNFKGYASLGYFLDLDDYLTADAKAQMLWSEIPEMLINRYCYDNDTRIAGKGASVLGLPLGGNPYLLYYNTEMLAQANINVISIEESALAGTGYLPHGYAEYKVAPADGLVAGTNNAGETVYKVFNNKIPMNWEEFRYLMLHLKKALNQTYSYFSEYWFEYGYSVGGDCVAWDGEKYVFGLNDKSSNYIATQNVTVNGKNYVAGEILSYEDKATVTEGAEGLYAIPSTYEAFLEFNRLAVPTSKTVDIIDDVAIKGYGLAPTDTSARGRNFMNGSSAFTADFYAVAEEFKNSSLNGKFDVTLEQQYREYEGGSLVNENADINDMQVKVIGETYNGSVYTGELKKVNGTAIVGKMATTSLNNAICIAKNSLQSEYDASFKFASWLAGPEGQALLAKGNTNVPNQTSVAKGSAFANNERYVANAWAIATANSVADMGDWAYFDEGSWVTAWADMLNTDVRKGEKTLTEFFNTKLNSANTALAEMNLRVYR